MDNIKNRFALNKKGFTLGEVLITIGILAVLIAVSFPAVGYFQKTLNQTKLDNSAREIFLSAQNKLTGMKSAGMDLPEGTTMGKVQPSDFDETGLVWPNTGSEAADPYVFVSSSDDSFTFMNDTPFGTDYEDGRYIIEFNRSTGDVYSVFYWEDTAMDYGGVSSFSYPENYNSFLSKEDGELFLRGKENRKNRMTLKVGYYGANGTEAVNNSGTFRYSLDVINADELKIKIMPEDRTIGMDTEYLITISSATDTDNKAEYLYRLLYQKGQPFAADADGSILPLDTYKNVASDITDCSFTLTLDSLTADTHFANLFPLLAAGDDLDVKVHAIYLGSKGILTEEEQKTARTNSLFASLRSDKSAVPSPQGEIVQIENGRHLQNLAFPISNFGRTDTQATPYPVAAVQVSADIDWTDYNSINTLWENGKALESFYPIGNGDTFLTSFDGKNHRISNLTVTKYETGKNGVSGAGLFGVLYDGFTVKNLTLYESYVSISGNVSAAAVTGCYASTKEKTLSYMENVTCMDCTVYSEKGSAGMLAGQIFLAGNDGSDTVPIADAVYITKCAVYLDDENSSDYYQMDSAAKRNYYVKSGTAAAGGLVGHLNHGVLEITDSFSAVNVYAQTNAGGLVGSSIDKLHIYNSYSSCDITQTSENGGGAGGILGKFGGGWMKIDNCFTTCDVSGSSFSGGAFGWLAPTTNIYGSARVRVKNTYSYGTVTWRGGQICTLPQNMTAGSSFSGGFVGRIENNNLLTASASLLDMRTKCMYLSMRGYNNSNPGDLKNLNGYGCVYNDSKVKITPGHYEDDGSGLAMPGADSKNTRTFAYSRDLKDYKFPFKMTVCSDSSVLDYHGNWPRKGEIEAALCYYEKYENGTDEIYGYYAVTTIGMGQSAWTLDTLKTQEELNKGDYYLTEDGYALISAYALSKFDYVFDGDIESTRAEGEISVNEPTGAYDLSEADLKNAGIMASGIHLLFKQQNAESLDIYANIYKLPFFLQEIPRDKAMEFYDRLDISYTATERYDTSGRLVSLKKLVEEIENLGDGTPVPSNWHELPNGSWQVQDGYTFYYCCHFAKTAINPYVGRTVAHRPARTLEIYVRSPRHLNAVGRYCYYWNGVNNSKWNKYTFEQEMDLNFSTYTKNYCGERFDMSPGGKYQNMPIGRTANGTTYWDEEKQQTVDYSNFQNNYDGGGYQIINFKMKTESLYYVGLFGEIFGSTLENINMCVDDGLAKRFGDYDSQYGAGYIIATYTYNKLFALSGGISNADTQEHNYGLGGLIGKTTSGSNNSDINNPLVTNCSVSGYTLIGKMSSEKTYTNTANGKTYTLNEFPLHMKRNFAFHVGGLVGFNNSYITNCSAENKLVKFIYAHPRDSRYFGLDKTVGGFAGSNQGLINGCYAGGKLEIGYDEGARYNLEEASKDFYIGGFSGTNCYPGFGYELGFVKYHNASGTYAGALLTDCYSFCTIEKNDTVNSFVPDENIFGVTQTADTVTTKDDYTNTIRVYKAADIHETGPYSNIPENVSNCYYLEDTISLPDGVYPADRDMVMEGGQKAAVSYSKMAAVNSFSELLNQTIADFPYTLVRGKTSISVTPTLFHTGRLSAAASKPYSDTLKGKQFAFPAVVKENNSYVHYGDWPEIKTTSVGLCYYERYSDGTAGYFIRGVQAELYDGISDPNLPGTKGVWRDDSLEYDPNTDKLVVESGYCYVSSADTELTGLIPDRTVPPDSSYHFYQISKSEGKISSVVLPGTSIKAYYNTDFACAIRLKEIQKDKEKSYASDFTSYGVRTYEQLVNAGSTVYSDFYFEQTMNIAKGDLNTKNVIAQFLSAYDGRGRHMNDGIAVTPEKSYSIYIDMSAATKKHSENNVGFVGVNEGSLKNILLLGKIDCTYENSNYAMNIGALAGINRGSIIGCTSRVDITVNGKTNSGLGETCVGGLIGYNNSPITSAEDNPNTVYGNTVEAEIASNSSFLMNPGQGNLYIGGFVGYTESAMAASCVRGDICVNTAIETKNNDAYAAGFAGRGYQAQFYSCYFAGNIGDKGNSVIGNMAFIAQFIGYADSVSCSSCYGWTPNNPIKYSLFAINSVFPDCYAYAGTLGGGVNLEENIPEWTSLGKLKNIIAAPDVRAKDWVWAFDSTVSKTPYLKKQ